MSRYCCCKDGALGRESSGTSGSQGRGDKINNKGVGVWCSRLGLAANDDPRILKD